MHRSNTVQCTLVNEKKAFYQGIELVVEKGSTIHRHLPTNRVTVLKRY